MTDCHWCAAITYRGREVEVCGHPERRAEPLDDLCGWEKPAFACGCGRGCVSWPDHHAKIASEDRDTDTVLACVLAEDFATDKEMS